MASSLDFRIWKRAGFSLICTVALSFLALSATAQQGKTKSADDYLVKSLPGAPDGPLLNMHAGHVEINHEHNGNLFFWHYAARKPSSDGSSKTVIWLNGGPGCSSMDGALMEVGPYRVREGGKLEYNNGSWDEHANLLFVDNPVGTGFSYVNTDSYVHELQEMADQFLIFLEKWFGLFPDSSKHDLYIAGESYAGQHIPYIAKSILDRNAKPGTTEGQRYKLKGLLIGNGWIDPVHQYQAYASFAYDEGLIQGGTPQAAKVDKALTHCLSELGKPDSKKHININVCESVLTSFLDATKQNNECFNMYDVRLKDSWPSCGMNWPPDLKDVTPYLRRDDVKNALHINREQRVGWSECNGAVSSNFRTHHSMPSVQIIPEIIEAGVPTILFSGAKDMICNHIGTEDLIAGMKWNGATGFETYPDSGLYEPKQDWVFEGENAGYYQEARNLTYILFHNSSHMVPFDYPKRARTMLDRFIGADVSGVDSVVGGDTPEPAKPETAEEHDDNDKPSQQEGDSKTNIDGDADSAAHEAQTIRYYHSGEAALLVVIIGAAIFGWWVWRGRRRQARASQEEELGAYAPLGKRTGADGDVEAQDFDVNEMQDMRGSRKGGRFRDDDDWGEGEMDKDPYDVGSDSDDSDQA